MPIVAADIEFRLSGGAANSDPDASLGGAKSSVEIVDATEGNLFDNVEGLEATAGDIEYRAFYVHNAHATLTWQSVVAWIQTETGSGDTSMDISVAAEGVNGTAQVIADENTAPGGESFTHPITKAAGISIGDIPPGEHQAIWVRRTVLAGAVAFDDDGGAVRCEGETLT